MRHFFPLLISLVFASTSAYAVGYLEIRAPGYNFRSAEYSTSHVYVDEVAGTTADIEILWTLTDFSNITDVEVYTNLNRRNLARIDKNADGYADGIQPVDGNTITDSPADTDPDTGHYFAAFNMTDNDSNHIWELTIPAAKTGAYRLTARFKTSDPIEANDFDPNNWIWYGLRDHAVVVAPTTSRDVQLYVMNVFNVEASGDTFADRSTLEDLHDAGDAAHNFVGGGSKWNLDYMKGLGMNWLWFQPIHPNGVDGREPSGGYDTATDPYDPGSPYAVKNFFEVNELMTVDYNGGNTIAQNRAASMAAFQEFTAAADAKDVGIMLDAPFNHTAFDVELGQQGVDLFQPDGQTWSPYDEIRNKEPRFFSRDYNTSVVGGVNPFVDGGENYGDRATSASDVAPGPDRFDFGKWRDVKDVYFGRYDALVEFNDNLGGAEVESYKNEGDWFDYTDAEWIANDFTQGGEDWNVTRRVWDYFAEYAVHWLEKTRPAGQNRNSTSSDGDEAARYAWDKAGIDGLRCDFGQGLPPQAWEYIINVARSYKWNFVMMSESLDGGAVTYRSSRHFEILNENIVFPLKSAGNKTDYRNIFEDRRSSYGQALVLANTTSHDEENYADPWQAVVRNAAVGMMDSASLIFPGQELGISTDNKGNDDAGDNYNFGFDHYETNFGKTIPHFKRWNSMMPAWNDSNYGNDQLYPVYSGIQTARGASPALRSPNRWFLDGDGENNQIFAAAKYETANASPATSDVVLAFSNLNRDSTQSDNFKIPTGLAPLLGLQDSRTYNVKNIAAYTAQQANRRDLWLWGAGITGADLKSTGFFVQLYKVPTADSDWLAEPYEAQYLKVYDVTPPPSVGKPGHIENLDYSANGVLEMTWDTSAFGPHDNIQSNQVVVYDDQSNELWSGTLDGTDTFSLDVSAYYGQTVTVQVTPLSIAEVASASASVVSDPVILLDPAGDEDEDGQSNENEYKSGTDPLNGASVFKVMNPVMSGSGLSFTIQVVHGYAYTVQSTTDLTNPLGWANEDEANAVEYEPGAAETQYSFTDLAPGILPKFYRVLVQPASSP